MAMIPRKDSRCIDAGRRKRRGQINDWNTNGLRPCIARRDNIQQLNRSNPSSLFIRTLN